MYYKKISFLFLALFLIFVTSLNVFKGLIYFGNATDQATLLFFTICKDVSYFAAIFSLLICFFSMKKHVES